MLTATQKAHVLTRPPRNDDELWWTVLALWNVKIPRVKVCPDHCAPFTAFADAYFARSTVALWIGSRGFGGKTFTLSTLGMTEMATLGAFVTILGGSGEQSQRVHESMSELWMSPTAPVKMLAKDPTKYDTFLTNGGKARTLMASAKSVRGPHPQRMRLDEADEMDLGVLTAAQGQPMSKRGIQTNTVMSSTHQYPDGTVTELLKRAKDKGWPVYRWCWRETANLADGWLTIPEVDRKRDEVPTSMWNAEYELQEPSFEGRAIDGDSVDRMFDTRYGYSEGKEGRRITIEKPQPNRDYITGADWAKSQDFTIIITWDATTLPWRLVCFERLNRRKWPVMVGRFNERLRMYGGKAAHDATGIGAVVEDYIKYPPGMQPKNVMGFTMAGRFRQDIITEAVNAVEKNLFIAPRIKTMYEEFKFATPDDLYNGSSSAHLPDTISATALSWHMRNKNQHHAANPITLPRAQETSPWSMSGQPVTSQWKI